ncbi:hypothetical protein [Paenibacillus sp. 1-18]|uniref:hypothetical protein n=1 Tax=Paenibacillus sp. 1-18 TaxID=1333846 RepID=UPI00047094CE|nr:hypothetical protein [Paenibacillus sp. 1-18]
MKEIITKISVENQNSNYLKDAHPTILIDGKPLDHFMNAYYQNDYMLGLIPMIVDWMNLDEESKLVEHLYDSMDETKILPILMCPDDCDLSCTVVVAEVETINNYIKWNRIGIDKNSPKEVIDKEGFLETGIEWIDNVPIMIFDKENYRSLDKIYKHRS